MGSFILVWFEGDVEKTFVDLATNDSEFSTWFRAQVLDVTGVDLAAPSDGAAACSPRRLARLTRDGSDTPQRLLVVSLPA